LETPEDGKDADDWTEEVARLPFTVVDFEEAPDAEEEGDFEADDGDPLTELDVDSEEAEELGLDESEGLLVDPDVEPEVDPEEVEPEEFEPEEFEPEDVVPEVLPEVDPEDVDPEDVELPPVPAISLTNSES